MAWGEGKEKKVTAGGKRKEGKRDYVGHFVSLMSSENGLGTSEIKNDKKRKTVRLTIAMHTFDSIHNFRSKLIGKAIFWCISMSF